MKKALCLCVSLVLVSMAVAQPYTFVFLNKRTDLPELHKAEVDRIMEGHMANINRLATESKLLVAGPFEGGGGIFVLNTGSTEEAKQWLTTDPGVKAERWRMEYLPVTFRTGGACAVGEEYEMTSYHFIRYGLTLTKFNVQQASQTVVKHGQYMKQLAATGNVIAEATFGDAEGSILIMRGDLDSRVVEASPAVQEQLYDLSIYTLWVAKGSFCEQ
jgi:uncharacterized protein YciI